MPFPFSWRAGRAFGLTAGLTVLLGAALPGARAQDAQTAPDADPPSRVAQLNYIDGPVTFEPAGAPVIVNFPEVSVSAVAIGLPV